MGSSHHWCRSVTKQSLSLTRSWVAVLCEGSQGILDGGRWVVVDGMGRVGRLRTVGHTDCGGDKQGHKHE